MEVIRLLPFIPILGAIIGVGTCSLPWVGDVAGIDLFVVYEEGFQRFIPLAVIGLSVLTAVLCVSQLINIEIIAVPFVIFFIGVAIMILTSVFSMWTIDSVKVVTGYGFWLSYLAGCLMIFGGALSYKALTRVSVSY